MRSGELAALAGVSVRTLRHYHQIGLLPEPERSSNGYREYTVSDLAAVLRVLSFTELGVPLGEVRRVLDDEAAATALLDRIDARTAAEVERLSARRRTIAQLRAGAVAPGLPPALLPYAALLRPREGASDRERVVEQEQMALIRHLSDEISTARLVDVLEALAQSPDRYRAVVDAFAELPADATREQVGRLADEIVDAVTPLVAADDARPVDTRAAALILSYREAHDNDAQRRVMRRVVDRLGGAG